MFRRVGKHFANQWLAIVLLIGGGTAYAATSGGPVNGPLAGRNTVGSYDIIDGQVLSPDIADGAVTGRKIHAPEPWQSVAAGSTSGDSCSGGATGVFCSVIQVTSEGTFYFPWENFGAPFADAGYTRDQLGRVELKGVVWATTQNIGGSDDPRTHSIFRLPAAYAPAHTRLFAVVGRSGGLDVAAGRIDVRPDGWVVLETDCELNSPLNHNDCSAKGAGYLSLDGISFRRDG